MKVFVTLIIFIIISISNIITPSTNKYLNLQVSGNIKCPENKRNVNVDIEITNKCKTSSKISQQPCGKSYKLNGSNLPNNVPLKDLMVTYTYNNNGEKVIFRHILNDCKNYVTEDGYHRNGDDVICILDIDL